MKGFTLLLAAVLGFTSCVEAGTFSGHAALAVVETNSVTGQKTMVEFDKHSAPGPGKQLVCFVRADSDKPCLAIVAAFNRSTGKPVNGWLPESKVLRNRELGVFPMNPTSWAWTRTGEAFDVSVVFLADGYPRIGEVKKQVEAIHRATDAAGVEKLGLKLRELIYGWGDRAVFVNKPPSSRPVDMGGVMKSGGIPPADMGGVIASLQPPEGRSISRPPASTYAEMARVDHDRIGKVESSRPDQIGLEQDGNLVEKFGSTHLKRNPHIEVNFSGDHPGVARFSYDPSSKP